jgi:hypothetical protein
MNSFKTLIIIIKKWYLKDNLHQQHNSTSNSSSSSNKYKELEVQIKEWIFLKWLISQRPDKIIVLVNWQGSSSNEAALRLDV